MEWVDLLSRHSRRTRQSFSVLHAERRASTNTALMCACIIPSRKPLCSGPKMLDLTGEAEAPAYTRYQHFRSENDSLA